MTSSALTAPPLSTTSVSTSSPSSPQLTLRGQTSPAPSDQSAAEAGDAAPAEAYQLTSLCQAFSIILSDPQTCSSIIAASKTVLGDLATLYSGIHFSFMDGMFELVFGGARTRISPTRGGLQCLPLVRVICNTSSRKIECGKMGFGNHLDQGSNLKCEASSTPQKQTQTLSSVHRKINSRMR
ncbi:hypothetical protein SRHO_G00301140 [Serrasalmus rhombeus]